MNPSVSCLCCTFGRPNLLVESIESFLRQDYKGDSELIILNTYGEQTLDFNNHRVRVFNAPARPASLGECRNLCANQSDSRVLIPWDDDDIFLPGYISLMVRLLGNRAWVKPQWRFNAHNHVIKDIKAAACHQIAYTREAWVKAGYYPHIQSGEDLAFVNRLREIDPRESVPHHKNETQFIYGWSNGVFHISGDDAKFGYINAKKKADKSVRNGKNPRGLIHLRPRWRRDYSADATKFLKSL